MAGDPRDALRVGLNLGGGFRKLAAESYERQCVEFILTKLGRADLRHQLLARCQENCGRRELRLLELCDALHNFPFFLAARVAPKAKHVGIFEFFKEFKKRELYRFFREAMEDCPAEFRSRPLAVIVKWPYVPHGLVIHNRNYSGVNGMRLVFVDGRWEYVVEPLAQFVAGLLSVYDPEQ